MRKVTALAAAVLATFFAGCTAFPTTGGYDLDWLAEIAGQEEGPPVQIVAIWTDASLKKAGSPETRGFGGRIYLYDSKERPVEADGDLIVYAFVEKDRQAPSKLPERKFVFKAEELKEHYSKTALGHSYSIWLPWDRDGQDMVSVSLLPTFKPNDEKAKVVLGAPSLNVLKGKEEAPKLDKMEVSSPDGVRPVEKMQVTTTRGIRPVSYTVEEDGEEAQGGASSRRRVSIYDPQTNVVTGPLPKPQTQALADFETELPRATGVTTTTFDLPSSMGHSLKNAPAPPRENKIVRDLQTEHAIPARQAAEPQNGTVFDLSKAAAIAEASAMASAVARDGTAWKPPGSSQRPGADEEDLRINRFNSRKRSPPSWERNRSERWSQDER